MFIGYVSACSNASRTSVTNKGKRGYQELTARLMGGGGQKMNAL